jgi:hypothetical protein
MPPSRSASCAAAASPCSCLGHPAQAVGLGSDQPLDHGGTEPGLDGRLDQVRIRQFLVPDTIVRRGRDGPGGFPDEQDQLDRHACPCGDLGEGGAAERREPLEGGRIEEVERDLPIPNRGAQAVQRDARCRQALHQPGAAQVAGSEPVGCVRCEDPELDEPTQLVCAHPAALRGFGQVVGLHGPNCSRARAGQS